MTSNQATTAAGAVPAVRLAPDGHPIVALPGQPFPLGATPGQQAGVAGTNFALATSVTLCLFDAAGAEIQIPVTDNDADIWHAEIDSYDPAAPAGAAKRHAGDQVTVGPRSIAVLRGPLAAGGNPP